MSSDTLNTVGKYLIALIILAGCFVLINATPGGDHTAYTGFIGLIVGWIVRDNAGTSATSNVIKAVAAGTSSSTPTDGTVVSGSVGS